MAEPEWDLNPATRRQAGEALFALVEQLHPICRSITGSGVRQTLGILGERISLNVTEVPTGEQVFDWTIPREWNVREAWVRDSDGRKVIDFERSNLHLVGYSAPFRGRLTLEELRPHLHTLPDHPDWIPYRTSYYQTTWGFCMAHRDYERLQPGQYDVCVDATLADGSLTYGECLVPGTEEGEVLISSHVCHPSLCNDNLSGVAVATALAAHLQNRLLRYSYRFVFAPCTIGAIAWLARNEQAVVPRIEHGLVLSCLGDRGGFTYKRSRRGSSVIDRVVPHVLAFSGTPHTVRDFAPYGYDERQYCSPGFDLPVGRLTRTPNGEYPEYHTSADNLDFISPGALAESLSACLSVIEVLEGNRSYLTTQGKGEPQLGRRGLYRAIGGTVADRSPELALLWVLNLADGRHSLLDTAMRSGLPFRDIRRAATLLEAHGLLIEAPA